MDLGQFIALLRDPKRSKDELVSMLDNARKRDAREYIAAATDVLDSRFPNWNSAKGKKGGATPTRCVFDGKERQFSTAKEAYLWLIERFVEARPSIFNEPSREETLYVALGKKRNYCAKTPSALFRKGTPELSDNKNNYTRLSNGWYANVNLSNTNKFEILLRFGALVHKRFERDWDFDVLDPTEGLIDKQKIVVQSQAIVESLLADLELPPSSNP
jgi:hypothetical protein